MQPPPVIAKFTMRRRVVMADTDVLSNVRLGAYIRMMEETEYAFLRSRGLSVVLTDDKGVLGFPRLHAQVEVTGAVGFDDWVEIQLSLLKVDGKQIIYGFDVNRMTQQSDLVPVAMGEFRVVCCRFPHADAPYAILTPLNVMAALNGETASRGTTDRDNEFSI